MPETKHQHHFEDLSPDDFERLIYWLVKRSSEFAEVQWYGGARDKGRDVVGYRHTEIGREEWYIQAKRYQSIAFPTLRDELDKLAEHAEKTPGFTPDAIVFATACPVPPDAKDRATDHAREKGLPEPYYWGRLELDERLKGQPGTEAEFFGASAAPIIAGDEQDGATITLGSTRDMGAAPPSSATVDACGYDLAAVRDLLLAAFTASDLRRVFLYTANAELRPLTQEFGSGDGLATLVEKTITFCQKRKLLPVLLAEVEAANPLRYEEYQDRLITEGQAIELKAQPPPAGGLARLQLLNRLLLAVCVAAFLFSILLSFTPIAEPLLAALSILGAILIALFPGIRTLDRQAWFKRKATTVVLLLVTGLLLVLNLRWLTRSVYDTDLWINRLEGVDESGLCGIGCTVIVEGQGIDQLRPGDRLAVYGSQARMKGGNWSEAPNGIVGVVVVEADTVSAQALLIHEDAASDTSKRLAANLSVAASKEVDESYLIPAYGDGYVLGQRLVRLRPGTTARVGERLVVLEPQIEGGRILDHTRANTQLQIVGLGQEGVVVETRLLYGLEPMTGTLVELLSPNDVPEVMLTIPPEIHTVEPEMVRIAVGDFEIGKYEISNEQFHPFVEGDGYTNPAWWGSEGLAWLKRTNAKTPEFWQDSRFNSPSQPVVGVNWYEVMAYVRWLSARTGVTYDLPTADQWLQAACGSAASGYPWGENWEPGRANYADASFMEANPAVEHGDAIHDDGFAFTAPVGSFPTGASPEGLLDMAGNVREWTATPGEGGYATHGGGWGSTAESLNCAVQGTESPQYRHFNLGFRLIRLPQ